MEKEENQERYTKDHCHNTLTDFRPNIIKQSHYRGRVLSKKVILTLILVVVFVLILTTGIAFFVCLYIKQSSTSNKFSDFKQHSEQITEISPI